MEANQQGQIKICDICQKGFPQQKIDLHEAYCRRNIKRCALCNQMYDINDQEGHEKQFHSKKECRYCQQTFPEQQWEVHQPSCKRRPLKCTYCDNDVAYEQIIRHEQSCGSRTTKCQICKKFIALRQFDVHKLSCIQQPVQLRNQQRALSRQDPPQHLERIRSHQNRRQNQNFREYRPYEELNRRHERNLANRVASQDKLKPRVTSKPQIRIPNSIKPSHIIEPQRIRELIDPVPISIRLAMGHVRHKPPLQSRN